MMSWPNGTTDPGAQYQQRPPRNSFFDAVRGSGWYRAQDRAIGGVCSGIAAHQGWDLSLVRVLMVVATFCMPVVAIAYGLGWLLLPEAADGRIHLEETLEGRFDVAVIGGVFMILAGLSSSLSAVGIVGGLGLGWIQLLALAAGITAVVVVLVSIAPLRAAPRPARTARPPNSAIRSTARHSTAPRSTARPSSRRRRREPPTLLGTAPRALRTRTPPCLSSRTRRTPRVSPPTASPQAAQLARAPRAPLAPPPPPRARTPGRARPPLAPASPTPAGRLRLPLPGLVSGPRVPCRRIARAPSPVA